MAGKAFATVSDFGPATGGTATQMRVYLKLAAGNGVNPPRFDAGSFIFDASLSAASNLSALKTAVVNQCAANGIVLTTADVTVFTAIN